MFCSEEGVEVGPDHSLDRSTVSLLDLDRHVVGFDKTGETRRSALYAGGSSSHRLRPCATSRKDNEDQVPSQAYRSG